jgi:hypothetical protein
MDHRNDNSAGCLVCGSGSDAVPLIAFRFKGSDRWICPQHLPLLIHDPGKLAGILPGAEGLNPADHHDE